MRSTRHDTTAAMFKLGVLDLKSDELHHICRLHASPPANKVVATIAKAAAGDGHGRVHAEVVAPLARSHCFSHGCCCGEYMHLSGLGHLLLH